jgi:hypothetical protein
MGVIKAAILILERCLKNLIGAEKLSFYGLSGHDSLVTTVKYRKIPPGHCQRTHGAFFVFLPHQGPLSHLRMFIQLYQIDIELAEQKKYLKLI